jgi:hypothetical protein
MTKGSLACGPSNDGYAEHLARLADTLERMKRAEHRCARSIELADQSQKCVDATFDHVARRAIAAMYAK